MYCCGPTVYDFAHIGNWRTFVFADLVRRYLEFKGFQVTHVMNITDVEDKIIRRVRETQTSLREFTGKSRRRFWRICRRSAAGCRTRCRAPRNTFRNHRAHRETSGARRRLPGPRWLGLFLHREIPRRRLPYGQLLKLNFDEMRAGERVKERRIRQGIRGRLRAVEGARAGGWRCFLAQSVWRGPARLAHRVFSAMSMKILGASFDLHLGGEDLIFPHHEDEIAQSEGATGRPFVKYWLHGAHLLVEGKKMSKSLGNFFTLRDLLAKGFTGREIRYLLLTAHYRETFNFTLEGLQGAKAALARIDECVGKLRELAQAPTPSLGTRGPEAGVRCCQFHAALDDDLNISAAWAAVFDWVRERTAPLGDIP